MHRCVQLMLNHAARPFCDTAWKCLGNARCRLRAFRVPSGRPAGSSHKPQRRRLLFLTTCYTNTYKKIALASSSGRFQEKHPYQGCALPTELCERPATQRSNAMRYVRRTRPLQPRESTHVQRAEQAATTRVRGTRLNWPRHSARALRSRTDGRLPRDQCRPCAQCRGHRREVRHFQRRAGGEQWMSGAARSQARIHHPP